MQVSRYTGSMKRRRLWLLAIPLVTGAAWYFIVRNSNTVSLLESPIKLKLITTEEIAREPTIDITLPLVGNIVWPRPPKSPFLLGVGGGWEVDPRVYAGVLFVPPAKRFARSAARYDTWTFENGDTARSGLATCYQVNCPRVFGSHPRVATVDSRVFADVLGPIRVRLPAMGVPEPKLPKLATNVGDWKVSFDPERWIAPAFPIRYRVRVDDDKGSSFRIAFYRGSDVLWLPNSREATMMMGPVAELRCTPEQPAVLNVEALFQNFERENHPLSIYCVIRRMKATAVKFRIVRANGVTSIVDEGGRVYAILSSRMEVNQIRSHQHGVDALQVGGTWINNDSKVENLWGLLPSSSYDGSLNRPFALAKLADSQVVDGVVYRVVEERRAQVILELPNPYPYRSDSYPPQ